MQPVQIPGKYEQETTKVFRKSAKEIFEVFLLRLCISRRRRQFGGERPWISSCQQFYSIFFLGKLWSPSTSSRKLCSISATDCEEERPYMFILFAESSFFPLLLGHHHQHERCHRKSPIYHPPLSNIILPQTKKGRGNESAVI